MGDSDSRPEASPARLRRIDPLTRSVWRLRPAHACSTGPTRQSTQRAPGRARTGGGAAPSPNSAGSSFANGDSPGAPTPDPRNSLHNGHRGGRGSGSSELMPAQDNLCWRDRWTPDPATGVLGQRRGCQLLTGATACMRRRDQQAQLWTDSDCVAASQTVGTVRSCPHLCRLGRRAARCNRCSCKRRPAGGPGGEL